LKGLGIALVAARNAKLDVILMDKDPQALQKSMEFMSRMFAENVTDCRHITEEGRPERTIDNVRL
jgi:3-hydroxyacyl-CoA dehydrogenase